MTSSSPLPAATVPPIPASDIADVQPPALLSTTEKEETQYKQCPYCGEQILSIAKKCKHCGEFLDNSLRPLLQTEVSQQPLFEGPPVNCRYCGGPLKKEKVAVSEGSGCIIAIVGLIFTPLLIGIPVIIYGFHLMSKCERFWRCKQCGEKFPRVAKWYEFG